MGRWRSVMHARSATKRDEPGPRSPGPGQLRAISIRFWPRCKGVSPLFLAGVEACQREVPGPESGFEKGCTRGTQSQSLRPRPEPEPGSFSGKNIFDHLWVQNWPILGSYAVGASGGLVSPPQPGRPNTGSQVRVSTVLIHISRMQRIDWDNTQLVQGA